MTDAGKGQRQSADYGLIISGVWRLRGKKGKLIQREKEAGRPSTQFTPLWAPPQPQVY